MKVYSKLKKMLGDALRIFLLLDVLPFISRFDLLVIMPVTILLNFLRTATDIFGSIALAVAADAIANPNKNRFLGLSINPQLLLYITVCCYAYSRVAPYLVRLIVTPTRNRMLINMTRKIMKKPHKLSFQDVVQQKNAFEQALQYSRDVSELPQLTLSNLHQPLFSVLAGGIIIFLGYGWLVGTVFVNYAILKIMSGFGAYRFSGASGYAQKSNYNFLNLVRRYKEALTNIDVVKVFGQEQLENKIMGELGHKYYDSNLANNRRETASYLSTGILPIIADFGVITYLVRQGNLNSNIGEIIFLLNFLTTINSNSIRFLEASYRALKLLGYSDEINKVLNLNNECHQQKTSDPSLLYNIELRGACIQFKEVSFKYPESSDFVLKNVSFSINPGERCAIVGGSGSGKSTIAKLLLRLYRPTSGNIYINGKDINTISSYDLTSIIGFLSQEVHLFESDTIKNNIAYGFYGRGELLFNFFKNKGNDANKNDVERLSEQTPLLSQKAGDWEPICKEVKINIPPNQAINNNDDSLLAEYRQSRRTALIDKVNDKKKADALSIGQKQRVGLARLLLRQSSIFVFDEPTSALDSEVEAGVIQTINDATAGKTSVMIAHRLNTIKNYEKIVVLDEGIVVQHGTHDALNQQQGKYQTLWRLQSGM